MRRPRFRSGTDEIVFVRPRDVHHLARSEDAQAIADAVHGPTPDDEDARAALVRALVAGELLLVRVDDEPRLLDEPLVTPLLPPKLDPVVEDDPRPTWISLELVHEAGTSLDGLQIHMTLPDGREAYARLGPDGSWRSDDVPRGLCELRVLDDHRLRERTRVIGPLTRTPPEPPVWSPGITQALRLRTTTHHRVVVAQLRPFTFST